MKQQQRSLGRPASPRKQRIAAHRRGSGEAASPTGLSPRRSLLEQQPRPLPSRPMTGSRSPPLGGVGGGGGGGSMMGGASPFESDQDEDMDEVPEVGHGGVFLGGGQPVGASQQQPQQQQQPPMGVFGAGGMMMASGQDGGVSLQQQQQQQQRQQQQQQQLGHAAYLSQEPGAGVPLLAEKRNYAFNQVPTHHRNPVRSGRITPHRIQRPSTVAPHFDAYGHLQMERLRMRSPDISIDTVLGLQPQETVPVMLPPDAGAMGSAGNLQNFNQSLQHDQSYVGNVGQWGTKTYQPVLDWSSHNNLLLNNTQPAMYAHLPTSSPDAVGLPTTLNHTPINPDLGGTTTYPAMSSRPLREAPPRIVPKSPDNSLPTLDDSLRPASPLKKREPRGEELSLACPYYKQDNMRFSSCLKLRLARIGDVKQHIYRHHWIFPQHYCTTCWEIFETPTQEAEHVGRAACQPRQPPPEWHGITQEQKKELGKPAPQRSSIKVQWLKIWHDVFGRDKPPPPSVYVGGFVDEIVQMIEDFYGAHITGAVRAAIRAQGLEPDEGSEAMISQITVRVIDNLQDQFRQQSHMGTKRDDASQDAQEQSNLSPVSNRTRSPELASVQEEPGTDEPWIKPSPSQSDHSTPLSLYDSESSDGGSSASLDSGSGFALDRGVSPLDLGRHHSVSSISSDASVDWSRSPISSPPLRSEDDTPRPPMFSNFGLLSGGATIDPGFLGQSDTFPTDNKNFLLGQYASSS